MLLTVKVIVGYLGVLSVSHPGFDVVLRIPLRLEVLFICLFVYLCVCLLIYVYIICKIEF